MYSAFKNILCLLFFITVLYGTSFAGIEPYHNFKKGQINVNDTLVVKDEKFKNPLFNWSGITNIKVQNSISLKVIDDQLISQDFSCKMTFKVEYFSSPAQTEATIIDSVSLNVNYSKIEGATYKGQDDYKFTNGYLVKITVIKISSPEFGEQMPPILQINSDIVIERNYQLNGALPVGFTGTVNTIQSTKASLKIDWPIIVGADEFDLEWATIDQDSEWYSLALSMAANSPSVLDVHMEPLFRNNATRITTPAHEYTISLQFNAVYIAVRMRSVHYNSDGIREEGSWDYKRLGPVEIAIWPLDWQEPNLNWQYAATYAEEGKKKEVISYFDGTLRGRQTVTLNNTDQTAIVQENIYDEFGRAAASILPAPVTGTSGQYLHYFRAFNNNPANLPYSFKDLNAENCEPLPQPLKATSGASSYYSGDGSNLFKTDVNKPHHKYIPDAEGYPLSVTQYTPDNTGRIKLQGGVGAMFQPGIAGESHTTKYYYSKPEQWELDRLFGNDVGYAEHYLKNMVLDPNGQLSLSYLNAGGKTIATALTGKKPNSLDSLSGMGQEKVEISHLLKPEQFSFNSSSLKLTANTTYSASVTGTGTFNYNIEKLISRYPGGAFQPYSNCYYELRITVKDDCNSVLTQKLDTVKIGSAISNPADAGMYNGQFSYDFTKIGLYYITFEFALSKDVIEHFTDEFIKLGTDTGELKKKQDFVLSNFSFPEFKNCFSDCKTAVSRLGTRADFTAMFKNKLSSLGEQGSFYDNYIDGLYTMLLDSATALQASCITAPASPCEIYRKQMLEDVSPGGQYAMLDANGNLTEPATNVITTYFHNGAFGTIPTTDSLYLASQVSPEDGSEKISPYDTGFNFTQLIKYWKPEWAEQFLSFHPEFCKLTFCNQNAASAIWDEKMSEINEASKISFNANTNPLFLLAADPFFKTAPGLSYKVDFTNDLNNYSKNVITDNAMTIKGINAFIDFQLYCADTTATTNQSLNKNTWDNCYPKLECRVIDREWQLYRDLYLELKQKYFELARKQSCNGYCDIGTPVVVPPANNPSGPVTQCTNVLDLSSKGIQLTEYTFSQISGENKYTYYIKPGYPGQQPTFVNGVIGISFKSCYVVKLPGNISRYFYNIWVGYGVSSSELPCVTQQFLYSAYEVTSNRYYTNEGPGLYNVYRIYEGYTQSFQPQFTNCPSRSTAFYDCYTVSFDNNTRPPLKYRNVWVEICYHVDQLLMNSSNPAESIAGEDSEILNVENIEAYGAQSLFNDGGCSVLLKDKISRFVVSNRDKVVITNFKSEYNSNEIALHDSIVSACQSNADAWLKALGSGLETKTQAQINLLRSKLIELCTYGGDLDHPNGSSSMPGGYIMVGSTQCRNFGDVIKAALGIIAFTNELNPWLLDTPYPYNVKQLAVERTITNTNSSICAKLDSIKIASGTSTNAQFYTYLQAEFGAAMKLTAAELDTLIKGCYNCRYLLGKDLVLPQFLEKNSKACITRTEYNAGVLKLSNDFPGITSTYSNYETIFANYLNQTWGFSFSFDQYQEFKNGTSTQLCNVPPYTTLEADPYACVKSTIEKIYGIGEREYQAYITVQKEKFRNAYINTCLLAKPEVKLSMKQKIFHYTLYYYDMAGNLVRTVPPEGVSFLTDTEMELVKRTRGLADESCIYNGPTENSNKSVSLQSLSATLSGITNNAIELWMYSQDTERRQILATTTDKKYILQVCVKADTLSADIYSLSQAAANDVSITLSNHVTVKISDISPLAPWTHVVIQGANLAKGTFQVWVNGKQYAAVSDAGFAGRDWEITSNPVIQLPENLASLKHLRLYNGRLMAAAEIAANATNSCLRADNKTALTWYKFNTPLNPGEVTAIADTSRLETQYNGTYPAHRLATTYAYNSTNQVIQRNTPDGGTSKFWYDDLNRLVISQNAKQLAAKDFSYTKYDSLGRIAEVGLKKLITSTLSEPGKISNTDYLSFLNQGSNTEITQTIYDNQPAAGNGIPAGLTLSNLRKRVAASIYRENPIDTAFNASYYSYDIGGNVNKLYQQINGLGLKTLDYEYDLLSGKVNFLAYQHGQNDSFYYEYKYDAENRLIEAASSVTAMVSGFGVGSRLTSPNRKVDAVYRYYPHGPLARMDLGDASGIVQGVDYAYTLQGWLKGVNGSKLGVADIGGDGSNNVAKDALAYSLNYYTGDYKPIGGSGSGAFALNYTEAIGDITGSNLYNGNISSSTYGIAKINSGNTVGYTYKYDQLNRLLKMRQHNLQAVTGNWGAGTNNTDSYKEDFSYDGNGNIKTLLRNGPGGVMDQLVYKYNVVNGQLINNKLGSLKDDSPVNTNPGELSGQTNYTYDETGNLIKDSTERITGIDWSVYGKIKAIKRDSGNITYSYDPSGNRVSKLYKGLTTWYVRDAQGNSLAVYSSAATGQPAGTYWKEQQLYGSSRLGMWKPNVNLAIASGSSVWNISGQKFFELNNHLGNVMVVVNDNRLQEGGGFAANVVDAQDYYAFGGVMPGRNFTGSSVYRYGFNGKENDNEVKGEGNQQDYGMRIYDPRIGKFLSVDPIAAKFAWNSTYAFAEGDVMSSVDLDGLEKYRIVSRSFAPLHAFEYTHFEESADKRTKFEVADFLKVSARIHTQIKIDLDKLKATAYINAQNTILKGGTSWKIDTKEINAKAYAEEGKKGMKIIGDYSAKNGTEIGPDIDIQFNFDVNRTNQRTLHIDAKVTGNIFPAQENMIFDSKRTGLFLGVSTATGGPLTGVWGSGKDNQLSKVSINVQTDNDGNFMGVMSKDEKGRDTVVSTEAYNKQFSDKKVWDQQKGREGY